MKNTIKWGTLIKKKKIKREKNYNSESKKKYIQKKEKQNLENKTLI